eukprot:1255165-Amphidinium_carterae.1
MVWRLPWLLGDLCTGLNNCVWRTCAHVPLRKHTRAPMLANWNKGLPLFALQQKMTSQHLSNGQVCVEKERERERSR